MGENGNTGLSKIRKVYLYHFFARCLIFAAATLYIILDKNALDILPGWNFFHKFSPFHILWVIWMIDMMEQLFPISNVISLGSMKLFKSRFKPIKDALSEKRVKKEIIETTKSAYLVMLLWVACFLVAWVLYHYGIINDTLLFIGTLVFYVCDLICVLFWCPFRLIMNNRCCTTCRIFNWDHLMMFTPLLLVKGFFARTLVIVSVIVWLVWEINVILFPEHFSEYGNEALKCENCTDKLCNQNCRRIRNTKK